MDKQAGFSLGDVVSLQRGTTYKSNLLDQDGPVLLGLASIARNGGFRSDSLRTYGGESAQKLFLYPGDIYVSLKDVTQSADLIGAVSRVPPTIPVGRLTQDTVKLSIDDPGVPPNFLYWVLRTPQCREYCRARAIGTTNLSLDRDDFLALPVPGVTKDRLAMCDLLDALDDKVAVNERVAETSDHIVRNEYLHRTEHIDTFMRLGDLGWLVRDSVQASVISPDDNYIGLEHIPRKHVWLSNWEVAEGIASNKSRFVDGDILFGKLRPYFHKVGLALTNGICSTDVLVVRPMERHLRGWLLAALSSDETIAHASAHGDGTRMPRAKWRDLADYRVPWPGRHVADVFNDLVDSLSERLKRLVAEQQSLAELRDTLLPTLMSGEIRLRDAEKAVEEAT